MTPLEQYPAARRAVYHFLWIAGLVLVAVQGWCVATQSAQPAWLTGCLAVYPIVGLYVGYQAQANTPAQIETLGPESE